jgi:hypothetical protein
VAAQIAGCISERVFAVTAVQVLNLLHMPLIVAARATYQLIAAARATYQLLTFTSRSGPGAWST